MTILIKYHALFVIFEKVGKFEFVACCKLRVGFRVNVNPRSKKLEIFFFMDC